MFLWARNSTWQNPPFLYQTHFPGRKPKFKGMHSGRIYVERHRFQTKLWKIGLFLFIYLLFICLLFFLYFSFFLFLFFILFIDLFIFFYLFYFIFFFFGGGWKCMNILTFI